VFFKNSLWRRRRHTHPVAVPVHAFSSNLFLPQVRATLLENLAAGMNAQNDMTYCGVDYVNSHVCGQIFFLLIV
jgi:hypothetical protein